MGEEYKTGLSWEQIRKRMYWALLLVIIGSIVLPPTAYIMPSSSRSLPRICRNVICIPGEVFNLLFRRTRFSHGASTESAAVNSLKTFNSMFATYKKKGYANLGRSYPVGNDPTVANNGKYCGLYYEVNNAEEKVTLIGIADANADFRSTGRITTEEGDAATYTPSIYDPELKEVRYLDAEKFEAYSKAGYWFALCKYYQKKDGTRQAYDKEYSRNHFALIAFPAEYGVSGESTFAIDEQGTVYTIDYGDARYRDTWYEDPIAEGWEIAK